MPITLIRHAQALHNVKTSRIAGQALDSPLTEIGIAQTKELSEELSKAGKKPTAAYYSPAKRCIQTMDIFLGEMDIDRFEDNRLLEMDQGTFVGRIKLITILNPLHFFKLLIKGKNFSFEKGESFNQVGDRMQEVIAEIESLHPEEQVWVFTHGLAMRCLLAKKHGWTVWRLLFKRVKVLDMINIS